MTNNGDRRAGKGTTASSVGNNSASERNRRAAIAQATRKRQRQRMVALARELEDLFGTLYGIEQVTFIYLNGCWIGARYSDLSEGGVVEYRHCRPQL